MNLSEIKYQIFVSSTYHDLIKAREEIIKSILSLYQIPIGMEMFSADNEEQWSIISKTIIDSDYYLLIIGHRYGSMTKEGSSYTEKEFDFAKSSGIPILAFLQDENVATTPSERDKEAEKQKKLSDFREKVEANAMVDYWTNENQLAQKAVIALIKLMQKKPRIGWIKADRAASPEVTQELASLSKENRELKHEIEQYKSKEQNRLPDFKLYANHQESLQIGFYKFGFNHRLSYIEPLDEKKGDIILVDLSGDIPKSSTTSYGKKIKEYNARIAENIREVNEYNTKLERQNRIADNNVEVTFCVENTGSKKANDLYIEITFPDEILLFEKIPEKEELTRPKNIPRHPYDIEAPAFEAFSKMYGKLPKFESIQSLNFAKPNFQIKGNQLTIKFVTLLHTRKYCMSEPIFLVPLAVGSFTAKVSFMSEELNTPILTTFEINIIKKENPDENEDKINIG